MEDKIVAVRTLIQATVVALVFLAVLLLLYAAQVFLVIFSGILLAILFRSMALWISKKTRLPYLWSLSIALIIPLLLIGSGIWLIAPDISKQAAELADRIAQAAGQLQQKILQYEWVNRILAQTDRIQKALPDGSDAASASAGFFSSTLGALGNFVVALAIGLFLAINPGIYMNGLLRLVPLDKRNRTREVLQATGSALASWLMAKIVAMAVIGVLTTVGLWFIGIDLALVLGIIAAILSFIPNIGPVAAIIPAALLALISGPDKLAYVTILYVGIQTFESYVLTPLLQQRMVDMPPALTIGMQILFGVLAGILGVIVATPLTAAAMVMIRMWYVEDMLGDRDVQKGG